MALDRQSIVRKDFPIGRRGYDPGAVDAHLSTLADEVERLRRAAERRSEPLSAAAGDQVRAIVNAAEAAAAQIRGDAEGEAQRIRAEARAEAQAVREHATAEASELIARVSGATTSMLERIDAIERELGALGESLRTGATRLTGDLELIQASLREAGDAAGGRSRPVPAAERRAPDGGEDLEAARLIALNMALGGSSREEVDRYLAENFDLADRAALLNDVYASVEG